MADRPCVHAWTANLTWDSPRIRDAVDEASTVSVIVRQAVKALADDSEDLPVVRLASRLEPGFRRAFLAAAGQANGRINLEQLAQAVASGNVTAIEAAAQIEVLSAELQSLVPLLRRGFLLGAGVAHQGLRASGLSMRFDLINPSAVTWTQAHAGDLITGITAETREAVRRLVEQAFREGRDGRQTARAIRDIVGLTDRQAIAVQRFRERLIEDGVPFERLMARAEKYAEAQRRWRATNIARTEINTASNAGQQALWQEAKIQGLIHPENTRRVWMTTDDDRRDTEICEPLDGVETGLAEPFPGGYMHPPAHPSCRCAVSLRFLA